MRLLAEWKITHQGHDRRIQLLQGNLAAIPPAHAVDILVVSSFPNDYAPIPRTVIGALYAAGISVEQLSRNKQMDLREEFSCWISHLVPGASNFERILCIESGWHGSPPEITDDIFRALAPATIGEFSEASIAVPLIGAGNQGYSAERVMSALLRSSVFWLRRGLKIRTLKIVVRSDATAALAQRAFLDAQQSDEASKISASNSSQEIADKSWQFTHPASERLGGNVSSGATMAIRLNAPAASPKSLAQVCSQPVEASSPKPQSTLRSRSTSLASLLSALVQSCVSRLKGSPNPVKVGFAPAPPPTPENNLTTVSRKMLNKNPADLREPEQRFTGPIASLSVAASPAPATASLRSASTVATASSPAPASSPTCDIFLSYAHEDASAAEALRDEIAKAAPGVRVFFDRHSLSAGGSWLMEIAESLDGARRVAALYTPNYWASKFCKDEFTAALLRQNDTGQQILFPIYYRETNIPYFFRSLQHVDCREADSAKLAEACSLLCKDLVA